MYGNDNWFTVRSQRMNSDGSYRFVIPETAATHPVRKPADPSDLGDADVFPLERRRADRHCISGRVTAVRSERLDDGPHNHICSLQMLDISDSGLGAVVGEPVEPGSRIAVFFPPHGPEHGFDLLGTIVRCQRREQGWEVGIQFEQKAAA
jgi:hypothetical protein